MKFLPRAAIKGYVLVDFVVELSPRTLSPKSGYHVSVHRAKKSSIGTSAMAEVTPKVLEVLNEPP